MIKLNIKQINEILNGKLLGDENVEVENISTDTRQTTPNGLFFALKGENFDAHDYLQNALEQGCVAVVVEHECEIHVPQIVVPDTRLALGQLAKWLKAKINPNVALVNNVAAAHLEGFGSIDGVARAKGEIYRGLNDFGTAIMNLDCCYPELWQEEIGTRKVRSFSIMNSQADYYADSIQLAETGSRFILHTPKGWIEICLPYLGEHNIANALAATALAMSVGANLQEVKRGLEQKMQVKGRLFPIQPCENLLLLDDTYNANVDSLQSAINVLQKYSAFRILVVGDMAELGENSQLCHQQVADFAKNAKLDFVVSFGDESKVISAACGGKHFNDKIKMTKKLTALIEQKLKDNREVVLLAKGSRRMKMEDVINSLKDNFVC